MLRATVERLTDALEQLDAKLLSLYPRADRAENDNSALAIVPFGPPRMLLGALPAALAVRAGRALGITLPYALLPEPVRAIQRADLVIDLSGISFVDGRGLGILVYNITVALLPALLGTKSMKFAQAMGPFETPLNRAAARLCLRCVDRIVARGRITEKHLLDLGVPRGKVHQFTDAAFMMKVSGETRQRAAQLLGTAPTGDRPWVAVSASSVVDDYCTANGRSYPALMARFIDWLIQEKGRRVLLLAHSTLPESSSKKNNDLPTCRAVHELLRHPEHCFFVEGLHHADSLRALIGHCDLLVASRFHAMISGLSMGVPSLLIGWSHKYIEVLEAFDLQHFALDYAEVDFDTLARRFTELDERAEALRAQIAARLPEVTESSFGNLRVALELLNEAKV